jgi:hypothetical protein
MKNSGNVPLDTVCALDWMQTSVVPAGVCFEPECSGTGVAGNGNPN